VLDSSTSTPVSTAPAPVRWRRRTTDPAYAFVWLWAAAIAWNHHLPWYSHLRFVRDWLPAVALLVVYNLTHGYADDGAVPHIHEMITADVRMWDGSPAVLSSTTVWLRAHCRPGRADLDPRLVDRRSARSRQPAQRRPVRRVQSDRRDAKPAHGVRIAGRRVPHPRPAAALVAAAINRARSTR
jgi:hypothetical protein